MISSKNRRDFTHIAIEKFGETSHITFDEIGETS